MIDPGLWQDRKQNNFVTVTNSDGLLELAMDADKHGRNRRADTGMLFAEIDPEGTHVMSMRFPHEHIAGKVAEPHWRTMWLVKIRGVQDPATVWLDVSFALLDEVIWFRQIEPKAP